MMQNKIKKNIAVALSFFVLCVPVMVYGQSLIPCGVDEDKDGIVSDTEQCNFNDIVILSNNVISFLMYKVAIPLSALIFMYFGARLILYPAKSKEWDAAKKAFTDIGVGFLMILGAYVLIKFVLLAFLSDEQVNFMKFMLDLEQ